MVLPHSCTYSYPLNVVGAIIVITLILFTIAGECLNTVDKLVAPSRRSHFPIFKKFVKCILNKRRFVRYLGSATAAVFNAAKITDYYIRFDDGRYDVGVI